MSFICNDFFKKIVVNMQNQTSPNKTLLFDGETVGKYVYNSFHKMYPTNMLKYMQKYFTYQNSMSTENKTSFFSFLSKWTCLVLHSHSSHISLQDSITLFYHVVQTHRRSRSVVQPVSAMHPGCR
jgi:hypothetical protein